ncbi:MAG: tagaturonate epimerase family protein [Phycisphaerae bacterium]
MATHPAPLGLRPSFGFGDRTGMATPGHVAALLSLSSGIEPIFAQQSIREMTRTGRTPQDVMADALRGIVAAGYKGPHAADADHLKTAVDIQRTAAAGFCFFTIDPSDDVDTKADDYNAAELAEKFAAAREYAPWYDKYQGKTIMLNTGRAVALSPEAVQRCAVKYGKAIRKALDLAGYIDQACGALGKAYEIELSVDETPQPTTLAEHYIIADQCLRGGMKLVSLAPRYVGDFEKGVDYKGDIKKFERELADHVGISALLGPYKLSLHSGSDKLSIYAAFARLTKGRFHVKTAGTSYLEALRVVARHEPALFKDIVAFGRSRYDTDRKTYHVSAENSQVPATGSAAELEALYLEDWATVPAGKGFTNPGRQILHCTFGSVLTDARFGPAVKACLQAHPDTYKQVLQVHFAKHLEALRSGM